MKNEAKRPRGRPRKPVLDGDRPLVSVRFKPEVRRQLEAAADKNGWSLAQEAAARIERSFAEDSVLGDSDVAVLLRLLGAVIGTIQLRTGRSWSADPLTALAAEAAILETFRLHAPTEPDDEVTRYANADILDREDMTLDPDQTARARDYEVAEQRRHEAAQRLARAALATAKDPSRQAR